MNVLADDAPVPVSQTVKSESDGSTSPPDGNGQKIPLPIDPHIASSSKCRGACGSDCPSTCISQPDLKICVEDKSGKFHEYWKYTGIIECGSAEGCRVHDKCYDDCAFDLSPMTCRRVCDKDCTDKYGSEPCALWVVGRGDFDSYILYSNPPVSDGGFLAGPCPNNKISSVLPKSMRECENGGSEICGTWTLQGNQYMAKWDNGASATLTIANWGDSGVVVTRYDSEGSSRGLSARYEGKLNGNKIENGKVTWTWNGRAWSGTWNANW
ncbi:MAG: hypothetical protein ACE14P_05525 [Methanotrichaceae archaeon]